MGPKRRVLHFDVTDLGQIQTAPAIGHVGRRGVRHLHAADHPVDAAQDMNHIGLENPGLGVVHIAQLDAPAFGDRRAQNPVDVSLGHQKLGKTRDSVINRQYNWDGRIAGRGCRDKLTGGS